MIWPTEVQQCASSVIPVHPMSELEQQQLLAKMNQMFLNRDNPQHIQQAAHAWARRKEITVARPDLQDGLVVVGFAGGGGSCEGIKQALGYEPHIAMNHNPVAMAMHAINHPRTLHYPEDIFSVDPLISTGGLPVLLGWFSPDCRHFSKAKGGTPVKKEIRGLAWVVLRWALAVRPRFLMLENVEEFRGWGPLLTDIEGNHRPDPARKGETFKAFIGMLSAGIDANHPALVEVCEFLKIDINGPEAARLVSGLGYNVDHRELKACDYGTPTIRKRLFVVGRCDGEPVVWPEPSHGAPNSDDVLSGMLQPWRTAAECIDWSQPTRSIFGRKKDLADNTLRRIVKGLQRFVIDNPDPFIVRLGQTGFGGDRLQYPIDQPLTTITSKAEHLLLEPYAVKCNHTSTKTKYDCFRGQSLRDPLQTITRTHGFAVAAPVVVRQFGNSTANDINAPLGTVTAGGGGKSQLAGAILAPHITKFRSGAIGQECDEPLSTITAGTSVRPGGNGHAMGVVAAHLVKHYGGNYTGAGINVDEPLHTITTVDHHALCTSHLVQLRGTCRDGKPITEPVPTLTAGGNHVGMVNAFLTKYYGTGGSVDLSEPIHAVTTKERFGPVESNLDAEPLTDEQRYNAWNCARLADHFSDLPDDWHLFPAPRPQFLSVGEYIIVDICMRMLIARELYNASGFPPDYIIDRDIDGTLWPKSEQVARCGNAVPPPFAEALVRANMPELCIWRMAA
ncbi:DNA cytosine methyltransferase [Yersinia enterocolitica]|uniref:DNA cytosine methyltransferase n=1 Tax=Yersinia enterocolitica TaxID=630 RepID=UPI0028BC1B00|nr:DNA cytosine methyltransferase [Yersinia enterocolitica]EKN6253521.1 DNA cytosine methyltransferase [Yersinia enterocolitica]ELI8059794.1 DNA cytosine methyltransferase [Yersinia enterocolitica]HEI6772791.1 DNA cytosine methyltransferase [Yersinia enterocolitica]HEI6890987.1 DNA cytosine methyltransferase [Yersinia enterocolitica]